VPLIDREIKKLIPEDSLKNLYDAMHYAFGSGGKRLRPILCLTVCKSLGADVKTALPFATAIELIHNFTLVHDDIEDGDVIRRNTQTIWKKYGIAHGINIGDGMIFKAYESLLNSTQYLPQEKVLQLSNLVTHTVIKIIEGQCMEFNFRSKDDVSIEEYMEMVWRKAGILFSAALSGGATIANASNEVKQALEEYGKKIGPAFQIRDDVLNLVGEKKKYGKEIGGDIKEGKRTIIIIHCLKNCEAQEQKNILKILNKGRDNVSDADVEFVISTVKKYNSIEFAQKEAENLADQAKRALRKIDNKELTAALTELADFISKRDY
jgi:geranylgeranyl pyrophosphate synthase